MESVVAYAPSGSALFSHVSNLIGLAIDARLHDVVFTDSAVIYMNIPCPEGNGVPLLDFKAILCGLFNHFLVY